MSLKKFTMTAISAAALSAAASAEEGFFKNHVFLGIEGGPTFMSAESDAKLSIPGTTGTATPKFKHTDVAGGLSLGYRHHWQNYFLYLKAGYYLSNANKTLSPTFDKVGLNAFTKNYTLRKQHTVMGGLGLGYMCDNGFSVAVILKGVYSRFKARLQDNLLPSPHDHSSGMDSMGVAPGFEASYHLNEKLSATFEYAYEVYNNVDIKISNLADKSASLDAKPRFHTLMVGLRYKFN